MQNKNLILLGVNVDHVATVRQARGIAYPDPVAVALQAEQAGADGITVHLREDRRHIQPRDVEILQKTLQTRMNLEMAATDEMIAYAKKIHPAHCCLVPEKREELTTEGGLDVIGQEKRIREACKQLHAEGIEVSLFIAPDFAQIDAAVRCGAPVIEIHTGHFASAEDEIERDKELQQIIAAVKYAAKAGLIVNAGHGLNYNNVQAIAAIPEINELNIGHSIIAQAILVGIQPAVQQIKQLMLQARSCA